MSCDALLCEAVLNGTRIQLLSLYRSPSPAVSSPSLFARTEFPSLLRELDSTAECLILGDINMCLIDPSADTTEYLEQLSSSGFLRLNDETPTRVFEGSSSIIDHAFGRLRSFHEHTFRTSSSGRISDHRLVDLHLSYWNASQRAYRVNTHRSIDYTVVTHYLEELDWNDFHRLSDPQLQAQYLIDVCGAALAHGSTSRVVRARFRPIREWMNAGLVHRGET